MTEFEVGIYGGVDTHRDTHVAAVVDQTGRIRGTSSFPVSPAGYRRLVVWMGRHGTVVRVGVEGTGSYGVGLARHLTADGVDVVEVNRPNRQARRRRGKNDTADAEAAARAALNGDATAIPKSHDGLVESVRALRVVFNSTRRHRARIACQIRDLIVCGPDELRRQLEGLGTPERVARCARFRPGNVEDPLEATKAALRMLARQHQTLGDDLDQLRADLDRLTLLANPALRSSVGVGADVASILLITAGDNAERLTSHAAFAALCGASPIEASSGLTTRHRLNRGGDRQANSALWRIVMVRLTCDPATKAYMAKRRAEGRSHREIVRCLKRYIAREIYRHLTNPQPVVAPGPALRSRRLAAGCTQQHAAAALGTDQSRISEIENNRRASTEITKRYDAWLQTLNPTSTP